MIKLLYNIAKKWRQFYKKHTAFHSNNKIDKKFQFELQNCAKQFDFNFALSDIFFLQYACFLNSFTTTIINNKVDSKRRFVNFTPAISVIIMANENSTNLERCMFALEKQHEKNFEVIIVGAEQSKKHKKLLAEHSILYLSLQSNIAAYNAHRLVFTHARGKFILYLHASDLPHPALLKELLDKAVSLGVFPMAKTCTNQSDSLPSSFCYKKGGSKVNFTESSDIQTSFSVNDVLFGKLYLAEKLSIVKLYPVELEVWMPFLDFLHYAQENSEQTISNDFLIKRVKNSPTYHHAITFTAGLKASLPALQQYLSGTLPECRLDAILKQVIFFSVPAHLSYLLEKPLSVPCLAVIYSHVAFYLDHCRNLFPDRIDEMISSTFPSLFYGRYMSSVRVQSVHAWFIRREGYKPDGVFVYENEGLNDLKKHLLPTLKQHYPVIYANKKKFCEYNQMEHLLNAILASRTRLILTSFWIHDYAACGRTVIQLWHGNGMMKKILMPSGEWFHQDYVIASSEACREEYSRIFSVPPDNVLTYGTIQTDMYFDVQEVRQAVQEARAEIDDLPENTRVCFFAPTFRQFHEKELPYYFCRWDYAEADALLEDGHTAILYKQHHMLKNLQRNRNILQCDLHNSPRGRIRQCLLPDIFNWVCACDVFMTDYSSAMFFPLLLNKPLIFYAPDLEIFLTDGNGTLIDYVNDVPGPIVTKPSLRDVLEAMDAAPAYVETEKYAAFKDYHMGACNGRAKERLLEFMAPLYAEGEKQSGAFRCPLND